MRTGAALLCVPALMFVFSGCPKKKDKDAGPAAASQCTADMTYYYDENDHLWCRLDVSQESHWNKLKSDGMRGVKRLTVEYSGLLPPESDEQDNAEGKEMQNLIVAYSGEIVDLPLRLKESKTLTGLEELDLHFTALDEAAAATLSRADFLKNLKVLNLENNFIFENGAEALMRSANLSGLKELRLGENAFEDQGARAIADAKNLKNLEVLTLNYCGIGDSGVKVLAQSRNLPKLKELDLSENAITHEGIAVLAASEKIRRLKKLTLSKNDIGARGLKSIKELQDAGVDVEY